MRLNTAIRRTHEGAPAPKISTAAELRRSVMACLLWEDTFYESGVEIANRITTLAETVDPLEVAGIAMEARCEMHIRHAPLLLLEALTRRAPEHVPLVMTNIIQRVDEMAESLAIIIEHQKRTGHNKRKIPHAWATGIRRVLPRFDEYQLAKYDRDAAIKLRDVLRIARPKPETTEQAELWGRAVRRELQTPNTWEVELSAGKDKRVTFERLLRERKLGYLALLRNLRNMQQAGVDEALIRRAIIERRGAHNVLPFRYTAAARYAPSLEPYLDQALLEAIAELPAFEGKTTVLVDVSGSMNAPLSSKSDMTRDTAAATLASIIPGDVRVFSFSDTVVEVPPRRGMAGVDAVMRSQAHGGTYLGAAIEHMNRLKQRDRLIVISDEQSHDTAPPPEYTHAYMINVASYQNGVGYGDGWVHISGFSENVLRYIQIAEQSRLLEHVR